MQTETKEELVDIKKMAEILKIKTGLMYRMANKDDFPKVMAGNHFRFFPSKVIAYLESN